MTQGEALEQEYQAWQIFVMEFENLYGSINPSKNEPMITAIRRWGERLVQLRLFLQPMERHGLLMKAEELYRRATTKDDDD